MIIINEHTETISIRKTGSYSYDNYFIILQHNFTRQIFTLTLTPINIDNFRLVFAIDIPNGFMMGEYTYYLIPGGFTDLDINISDITKSTYYYFRERNFIVNFGEYVTNFLCKISNKFNRSKGYINVLETGLVQYLDAFDMVEYKQNKTFNTGKIRYDK